MQRGLKCISEDDIIYQIKRKKVNIKGTNVSDLASTRAKNLTCPPKLRITSFTSSLIPISFLTYNKKHRWPTWTSNWSNGRASMVFWMPNLLAGFVQPPHNQRYINNITESRHCKEKMHHTNLRSINRYTQHQIWKWERE